MKAASGSEGDLYSIDVPHHARPFGAGAFVDLSGIGGAADDSGERFVGSWQIQPVQLQRPPCPADGPTFCRPPHYEVEHGAEVSIDRVAIPAGLAVLPSASHSQEVLAQRYRRGRPKRIKPL
jgi:hypothetical protein